MNFTTQKEIEKFDKEDCATTKGVPIHQVISLDFEKIH
jgi:hypothetical protein